MVDQRIISDSQKLSEAKVEARKNESFEERLSSILDGLKVSVLSTTKYIELSVNYLVQHSKALVKQLTEASRIDVLIDNPSKRRQVCDSHLRIF
jgi:hypothetical protein